HDFLPNYPSASRRSSRVGWHPVDAASERVWKTGERELRVSTESSEPAAIEFGGKPIGDFYAYNELMYRANDAPPFTPVGDLRLRFTWFPESGSGGLTLRMNRDEDEFTCRVAMDGTVRIEGHLPGRDLPADRAIIGEKKLDPFAPGSAYEIE